MEYRRLGRSGLRVSAVSLGSMNMGSWLDRAASHRVLDAAFDAGINLIDTAEMYPSPLEAATQGRSEEVVGAWLEGKPRDAVILATKISGANRAELGDIVPHIRGGFAILDWHHFARACEASLKRLKVDYIDLYQTHWPDRGTPIAAQLEAFERLIEAGKVRYAGVSNETPWGLMRLLATAETSGLPRIVAVQNSYSLVRRDYEAGLAEVCVQEGVGMLPFSPLGEGVLTGKYTGGKIPHDSRFAVYQRGRERFGDAKTLARADAYVDVARAHGLEPTQMAIAWVKRQPGVASVISSASNVGQVASLAAAADLTLSNETLAAIATV